MEAGGGVGQEVPDEDENGAGDRDQGLELAAAFDDAPVAFAEEGVGLGGRGGGVAERALEVGVALAGLATTGERAGLDGAWAQFRPRHQVRGGGEPAHVEADLGEDHLRRVRADAGDLVEAVDGAECGLGHGVDRLAGGRATRRGSTGWASGIAASNWSMRAVRVSIWVVDLVQQHPGEFGWSSNRPSRAATKAECLVFIRPRASPASTFGSRCPAISASIMARPDTPMMSVATADILIRASSSSFSSRCTCRDRSWVRSCAAGCSRVIAGSVPAAGNSAAAGPSRSAWPATPRQQVRLGSAGTFLTSRALTSCTSRPAASSR